MITKDDHELRSRVPGILCLEQIRSRRSTQHRPETSRKDGTQSFRKCCGNMVPIQHDYNIGHRGISEAIPTEPIRKVDNAYSRRGFAVSERPWKAVAR